MDISLIVAIFKISDERGVTHGMSMEPYYTFIGKNNIDPDRGFHSFSFDWYSDPLVAVEYYCSNPECDCRDVLLTIERVSNGKTIPMAQITVDTVDWQVKKLDVEDKKRLDESKLRQDFGTDILETWKDYIQDHLRRVMDIKQNRLSEARSKVDASLVQSGAGVGYVEVFGEWEPGKDPLSFEYGNRHFLVDEQYCMDPSCDCREGILTFIEIVLGAPVMKFVIQYYTKGQQYGILENRSTRNELGELVTAFESAKPMARKIVARHYEDMKKEGKRILQAERCKKVVTNKAISPFVTVGRNESCPCGSGKKYKKCCGQ